MQQPANIAPWRQYNSRLLTSDLNAMPADTSSRIAATKGFGVPNRIGSLNFCPTCGNLLDVPKDDDVITCAQCGHTEDAVRESESSCMSVQGFIDRATLTIHLYDHYATSTNPGDYHITYHPYRIREHLNNDKITSGRFSFSLEG